MTKVLIVDVHAEMYRDRLRTEFPALQFAVFHNADEVAGELSDIDAMMMFGLEIRDAMLSGAPKLKWIQSLATGVDHFLRCPSLKPEVLITSGRGIHGPPMREQVVYMMMAVSRDAKRQADDTMHRIWQRRLWSTLHGKTAVIVGTGVLGAAIGELLKALGMQVVGVTRTPRQTAGFDVMMAADRLPEAAAKADYSPDPPRGRSSGLAWPPRAAQGKHREHWRARSRTRAGGTLLPRIAELALGDGAVDGFVKVGIIINDDRVLPAHFGDDALHMVLPRRRAGGLLLDRQPDRASR